MLHTINLTWLKLYARERRRLAARRRKLKKLDPFKYCQMPKLTRLGILWKEIEIVDSGTVKGKIVRAREDLPEGLCIPYGGIFRSHQEAMNIAKHNNRGAERRNSHGAAFEIVGEKKRKEYGMVDAHPNLMQDKGIPDGAWPGGFCNQADLPEQINAVLFQHDGECRAPHYDYMDDRARTLFVRTLRAISIASERKSSKNTHIVRRGRHGGGSDRERRRPKAKRTTRCDDETQTRQNMV